MSHLEGKVALVTGSSRGIGQAVARALAHAGADVAVHGRQATGPSAESAAAFVDEVRALGRRAEAYTADIAVRAEVEALMARVAEDFSRLDVLVLNAARAPFKPSDKLFERDLRQLMDTNFMGHVFCLQKALPLLEQDGGHVVFVSSLGSRFAAPMYPLGPMKAAMEAMVRQWGDELGPKGVNSNAVCAGLVKTDAYKTLRRIWRGLEALPDDAFVTPEEIADIVLFLTSPAARAIRGQTLVADRGLSNRMMGATGR